MGILRERILNGLTWLVVLLTPLTGIPHFVCRCPNGRTKPYCLGFVSKTTGCCCGCACCRRHADAKRCCCQGSCASSASRSFEESASSTHGSVEKTGCSKMPAEQAVFASRRVEQTSWNVSLDETTLPACRVPLAPRTKVGKGGTLPSGHSLAPPADLVTLLGRLLI